MAITLTEKAAKHVSRFIDKRGKGIGLRFGVRTTGCSGLAYKLEYVDDSAEEDQVFESHGVRVFIDPISISYLRGATIEFNDFKGGFTISNPNATSTCGCGSSFTSDAQR